MIVLITGGASGLGESITRLLASKKGNIVYFTYNQSENNSKKITSSFPNAFSIKCDFTNEDDIECLKNKMETLNIDVLINNAYAGEAIKTYFHKIPQQDFLLDFKNNVIPTIAITQTAIDVFRKKKFGKIITILTGFLVDNPPIGSSVYTANKAYLDNLTKVWAHENTKYNISSNSISPGFMLTPFTKSTDERVIEQMINSHPLKKLLTTDEVAESVLYFTNASQQVNGINLIINSGTSIR